MKHLLVILSILSLTTASLAAAGGTHFVCGHSQQFNSFSVQYDGPRFGDALSFTITNPEIQELLFDGEQWIKAHTGRISGFLTFGTCKKGVLDTLVTCKQDKAFLNYTFSHTEELSEEYFQNVTYDRHLKVKDLSLVVKDVDGIARLDLTMTFSHLTAEDVPMHISRNLGKIDAGPGSCNYQVGHQF